MTTPKETFNGFLEGFSFVWKQTKNPIKHPTFWLFFTIAILIFGSLGVWYEWRNVKNSDYQALFNAFILLTPPLISSAYLQLLFSKVPSKPAKGLLGLFVALAGYIFFELIGTTFKTQDWDLYFFTAVMVFITLWITWIQLSLNDDLYDFDPQALGPNPKTELPQSRKRKVKM
ncbi:hypothetical protein [Acinetobacter sp. YZS-X1-1]|uniref:hypothetical protein n=1 Tax=Acinetobacter sp. YZS-X1-1 TaxID=1501691 RepID=UPI00054CB117|nr:hypothetical protein [Acinetobacter sp. YZS-X1-1]